MYDMESIINGPMEYFLWAIKYGLYWSYEDLTSTSMLVTDVGDEICWDNFKMLVTVLVIELPTSSIS